jgi:DNA invertase Pin-like site-specific DNA recombinase
MKVGYARVSTHGQTLESQLDQLKAVGCVKVYQEIISGGKYQPRKQLKACLDDLEQGQTLVVTRLDRLARSTMDLLIIVKTIADKNCVFTSIAEPWADTTTATGRLILTVLGGLAEFERELIKIRTGEGRERAIKAGIRMGRKPKLTQHQIAEVRGRKAGGESTRFLARSYGVSPNTISRIR